MPEIAGGNLGTQTDVPTCAPQSPSPPFPPSPSDGVLSGSLPVAASGPDAMSDASSSSSGTTMEDLLSESSYSSAPSPCSSYSYNRADFPYDNEIEEFRSPSFESAPSSSASFVSRQDSLTNVVPRQSSRRQLLRKVREKSDRLLILLGLLEELPWSAIDPYKRPRRRIKQEANNILGKASALMISQGNIIRRVFTIIPPSSIEKLLLELENAIGNASWLIRLAGLSSAAGDEGYLGLPPIAHDEPVLFFIWEQVAKLLKGSPEDQAAAAAELESLDGKLIIEEGGVQAMLSVLMEGKDVEVQERAAKALGSLGGEGPWGVDLMVQAGICSVFTEVLNEGAMKVQAMVAWAVSELAAHHPQCQCQGDFVRNYAVQLLVGHLAFETFQEQKKSSAIPAPKAASIPSDVLTNANANAHIRGRELEDPATKSRMKAMAARALSALAKGNSAICKSITETQALLTLAVLLEKGTEEVRSNSAIAIMEIARVDPNAVVNQLLQIVQKAEYNNLLVPSIVALGCLTFRVTEMRLIGPLVRLLDEREADAMLDTLTKFAETDDYLCKEHCKVIINAGGVWHLVKLLYFGELVVQKLALILLCSIANHVTDREQQVDIYSVIFQSTLLKDKGLKGLLTTERQYQFEAWVNGRRKFRLIWSKNFSRPMFSMILV